jgi:deoxyribodipyrimidine photo-lyase
VASERPQFGDVPALRVRRANQYEVQADRPYVVYWMTSFRRTRFNFALQRARDWAVELKKPLVILEPLRVRYRWASDRFHRFIIEGMRDNAQACQQQNVIYYPYVESQPGDGRWLVHRLAELSAVVVTDDYPCFFHPRMIRTVAGRLPAELEAVDSNCLMPLAAAERTFTVAHSYRRWMQKQLPEHLQEFPEEQPLDCGALRKTDAERFTSIVATWPAADFDRLLADDGLSHIPVDHSVQPAELEGGPKQAERLLQRFVEQRLDGYDQDRNEPDEYGSSELSPYLHFGHISAHEVFSSIMQAEDWSPPLIQKPNGKVNGFWGVDENAEAFLDQLCTWREMGFNMSWREADFDKFESLPGWALKTIHQHARDPREHVYTLEQFETAETHDEIWNAAQRQLVREGRIHNYLRMLWGKKILHWTEHPRQALEIMLELNNKYALDGRDPNSYSGIFWVLGRYDRAWGPERPIFGKIRYMTSENTAKKHKLTKYLERYSE